MEYVSEGYWHVLKSIGIDSTCGDKRQHGLLST